MSNVPADIAGIGSTQQRLRVSPGFDPLKAAVAPDEYFLLSRIDGKQTLRDVLLAVGLPVDRGVAIVTRLRTLGALLLPGENTVPAWALDGSGAAPGPRPEVRAPTSRPASEPVAARTATPITPPRTPRAATASVPPRTVPARASTASPEPRTMMGRGSSERTPADAHDLTLPDPTADELTAMAERVELEDRVRRRVLALERLIPRNDPHALLGVPTTADARTLKRAYFLLSKEVHPDRYYGKPLGSFAERMNRVFEATSRAYAHLTGTDKARPAPGVTQSVRDQPQTPQEYASELFDRACQLEVSGDSLGAMKLFSAAVRIDPQVRYLRRATSCALAAKQPRSAVEYAKKATALAPNDVSCARLLAASFRAAGKLEDAEEVLIMAMALKNENDVLTAELRNDLAEVRRLLASS